MTTETLPTIAFIGLGAMGLPMARNLARAGYALRGFDIRREMADQFAGETLAMASASPAECVDGADVAITILPTSDIVEKVAFGENGIASARLKPSLLIEMTSGVPERTRAIGERLAVNGIAVIDAPVSGGVARAASGELAIMVGGDVADMDRAQPILQVMGKTITHVGDLGAGQALKALNNLVSAAGLLIAAEAVWVAKKFGLDAERVVDVLNNSSGMNNSTRTKLKPFVLSGSYASGFGLDLMVKDLNIALDLAGSLHAQTPFAQACLAQWENAARVLGPGRDHTEIAKLAASLVGIDDADRLNNERKTT